MPFTYSQDMHHYLQIDRLAYFASTQLDLATHTKETEDKTQSTEHHEIGIPSHHPGYIYTMATP